jgi:hypothetical protein
MKNSEFKAIEKRLERELSGFAFNDRLMFLAPVKSVLRGFCFEPTRSSKDSFYLWAFFQPLFVPAKEVRFLFGHRLDNGRRLRNDRPNLDSVLLLAMKSEMPNLLRLQTAKAVASALEPFTKPNGVGFVNPHCREAYAYSLIQAGQPEKANRVLDTLVNSIDTNLAWQQEILSRAVGVLEMLTKQPQDAIAQMECWEIETARNLGLEKFLTPDVSGSSLP